MAGSLAGRGSRFVPHVRQSLNWDCGLACSEMVLRAFGVPPAECSLQELRKQVPVSSIWTIDIAYVMRTFGVRFRYCTMTLGVDPTYQKKEFYRETLDTDSLRVNDLFAKAEENQVSIEHRSLSKEELCELMRPRDTLVMALVDRTYLYKPSFFTTHFGFSNGFVGHYVLLLGYDAPRDGYHLLDPARTAQPEFVRSCDLHKARCAHGTDEDLIIIPWEDNHSAARLLRVWWGAAQKDGTDVPSGARESPTSSDDEER
mmetsp:Transcript_50291/g.130903  ORF Transcript_50291/g.130903 Transcript_50291/m.130903 type:complete len:258 (-) Transcript_50291:311-1084(-)